MRKVSILLSLVLVSFSFFYLASALECENYDINNNAIVNQIDADLLNSFLLGNETKYCNSTNNVTCDVNKDGLINSTDLNLVVANINMTCDLQKRYSTDSSYLIDCLNGFRNLSECDINKDGGVEPSDFSILINVINGVLDTNTNCDIDGNGGVEPTDYLVLNNFMNGMENIYCNSTDNSSCDIDKNGGVEPTDVSMLLSALNGVNTRYCTVNPKRNYDLNGNGKVDLRIYPLNDLEILINCLNGFDNIYLCDIDGNGGAEPGDMSVLINALNGLGTIYCNETNFSRCDLNGNGILDPDFSGWQANLTNSSNETNPTNPITTTSGSGGGGGCLYNENYDWKCSGWDECINGTQERVCLNYNNCGTTYGRPETIRQCLQIEETANINEENRGLLQTIFSPITGAVTGTLGTVGGTIALGFIVLVLAGLGVVIAKRTDFSGFKTYFVRR